ncbi:MAG: radical SAM protein [Desulfobacteraceae bacterium]|nr:MAG: radical SAM protein [Desulfobacteraceae bacterium]
MLQFDKNFNFIDFRTVKSKLRYGRNMMRLLLINPSNSVKGLGNVSATAFPPLNLPYIAALTPSHYQIDVIDENVEPFEFRDADIVGLTAYTASVHRAYEIAQLYREKGIPTVIGGIHASMLPDEASQYCDVVAVGEAESIWPEIIRDFENKRLKKIYRGEMIDLKNLPIPRRDILKNAYYKWGSIQTSRGCPNNCSFCSVTAFNGRKFRRRPLHSVMEELETIPQKYIMITDDNLAGYHQEDREWAKSFFRMIIEKKIKKLFFIQASIQFGEDTELLRLASKAGVKIALVGMESVNPKTLKSYKKNINLKHMKANNCHTLISNIRKAGILFLGTFVIGGDEDDISSFHTTLDFIQSSHIDILQFTKLTPLPGTALWNSLKKQNRLLDLKYPEAWKDYRFTKILYKPLKMSITDIDEGNFYMKKIYFSFRETLKRTFFTLMTTKSILTTIIAFKFNQSYKKSFVTSDRYPLFDKPDFKKRFEKTSPFAKLKTRRYHIVTGL